MHAIPRSPSPQPSPVAYDGRGGQTSHTATRGRQHLSTSPSRRAFGLLELLTALAFLVIVMGLMVSLARYVRATSAERITRNLLRQLNDAMAVPRHATAVPTTAPATAGLTVPNAAVGAMEPADPAALPEVDAVPPPGAGEAAWAAYARATGPALSALLGSPDPVTDAWGNPVIYLPAARPEIGMAPDDRPFCLSPGPDGRYLTQADNLYGYEERPPARRPVDTANNAPAGVTHP